MKAILILTAYLLSAMQIVYSKDMSLNQAFRGIFNSAKPHDVQFVIQDLLEKNHIIINEIYKIVSQTLPTSCISLNASVPEKLPSFRASSGTLIIYTYTSESTPNYQETENIIRVIVHDDNRPKVLLITVLKERNNNFESLFKQMWIKRILNVAILDLSVDNGEIIAMTVHHYNPFTEIYERRPCSSEIQWFPDKTMNLNGYPIKIHMFTRPGYNLVIRNSQGYPLKYIGPDGNALKTLKSLMNFTIIPSAEQNQREKAHFQQVNGTLVGYMGRIQTGETEMLLTTSPYFMLMGSHVLGNSLPVINEAWCAVVPVTYTVSEHLYKRFLGIVMCSIIIIMLWILSICLKFDKNFWDLLYIFGTVLSVSMPRKPSRWIERLCFLVVLQISYIISSNLYAALATINLQSRVEKDYKNYEELNKSGLILAVHRSVYNVTLAHMEGDLLNFRDNMITTNTSMDCWDYLTKHRNVSCFMETKTATALIFKETKKGVANVRICKNLCYWKPPVGYAFYKHSPYIDRVSECIIRLEAVGLRKKWFWDYNGKMYPKKHNFIAVEGIGQSLLKTNLINIIACGYFIAFIVFLFEVFMHYTLQG